MSRQPTFHRPCIPMHGLFFIEERVGDKIDHLIYILKAQKICKSEIENPHMPVRWVKYKERRNPRLVVNYNHKRDSGDPFNLGMVVEKAREFDFWELWAQKLVLHIVDARWKDRLYYFKNERLTPGSDAEAWVYNYYSKQYKNNLIERVPLRHLVLRQVTGLEPYDWQNTSFFTFLNRHTHGLILPKEVKRLTDHREVDVRILEKW